MNLRVFKKDVEYFVGEFIDDCSIFITLNPGKSSDKMAALIGDAVELYNNLKDKANSKPEDKKPKAWYDGLRKDMFDKLDDLYASLSEIIAAANKEEKN